MIDPAETPVRIGTREVGTAFGQEAQDADLVGGARPAAGQDERKVAAHGGTLAKAGIG